MDRRRLVSYVLLNIFISAVVTGAILYWYDRNLKATSSAPAQAPLSAPQAGAPNPEPTLQPAQGNALGPNLDISIQIVSVVGAGNITAEVVILHYVGDAQLDLTNWQLKDGDGNIFLFPAMSLAKDGAVQIHTSLGTNTVIDLYWNLNAAVWKSGETASLYDANGNLRAVYKVP